MTTVSSLPAVPTRGSVGFGAAFEAVYVALKNNLVPQVNLVAGEVNSAAAAAAASASSASISQGIAAAAAAAAVLSAGSSFKGAWSSLSGALAVPATVAHNGLTWVLLSDLANVATATPGVSASWQCLQKGVLQVVAASTNTPFTTTSSSYVDAGLSAVITPLSTLSKVLAVVSVNNQSASTSESWAQLYRGATALTASFIYTGTTVVSRNVSVLDSPGSVAALTYSLKTKASGGGSSVFNRTGGTVDTLFLMEVL